MKRPDQILSMGKVGALPKSELKDDVCLAPVKIGV
jgi:hypothetical protein